MNDISVFGAGAFGTALAISLAKDGRNVSLIARSDVHADQMNATRANNTRLKDFQFPDTLTATADPTGPAPICLMTVPTQTLAGLIEQHTEHLKGRTIVACCKGVDLNSGLGPTGVIQQYCPTAKPAILSGPSFAVDIAAGLPTALTLAAKDETLAQQLQTDLSTANLRLYRTTDVIGVELGGALKNVIAIGAGVTIGAGLGESARAALITRGFAEMKRFAKDFGANPDTLSGLSGLGDLVLTCTSDKSRNYRHGLSLGSEKPPKTDTTEGISTALVVADIATTRNIDMPITSTISALLANRLTISQAITALLSRPLKEE
ncbi:MAG: glycerol-3-phosphate dehydrogenase [Marinosulfonomonas sp.]|nr:MAG: glycerol-3-phosphate dehydrogenase [Marinosulfonomonas sp.]